MKQNKILLIGCGMLGVRHLQAIASLKNIDEIYIMDPNPQVIESGKLSIQEISDLNPNIQFKWLMQVDEIDNNFDLCIIATQAKERSAIIKQIAKKTACKKFFIEKIVTQSIPEYKDLLIFCEQEKIKIWVNCKTRAYGIHQYIKSKLNPQEPIVFSDFGGNHGLANNGVHAADLFIFYDGSANIHYAGSRVDSVLHSSKRGKTIFDLSGTLFGFTDKGSDFILSFSPRHVGPDHISIVSANGRFIVDHHQKFAYESYVENNWQWKPIPIDENWNVSHMSKKFVSDILQKDSCQLPTLRECFPAHEFILRVLQPHFNQLLKTTADCCPVT